MCESVGCVRRIRSIDGVYLEGNHVSLELFPVFLILADSLPMNQRSPKNHQPLKLNQHSHIERLVPTHINEDLDTIIQLQ